MSGGEASTRYLDSRPIFFGETNAGGVGEMTEKDENVKGRTFQVSDTRGRGIDRDEPAPVSVYRGQEGAQAVHSDAGIEDREEGEFREQNQSVYGCVVDAHVAADMESGERVFQADEVVYPAR